MRRAGWLWLVALSGCLALDELDRCAGSTIGACASSSAGVIVGSGDDGLGDLPLDSGQAWASGWMARRSGPVSRFHVHLTQSGSQIALGLYSDAGGPDQLLVQVASEVTSSNPGWVAIDAPVAPVLQLSAGATYWIAVLPGFGTSGATVRVGAEPGRLIYSDETTLSNLDTVHWTSGAISAGPISTFID